MTGIKYMHHVPGRLRVKSRHFGKGGESCRRAIKALQALHGVELVKINRHAGSLTVHYDPSRHGQADLLAVLVQAGCLEGMSVSPATSTGKSASADGLANTFGKALVGVLAQKTATRLIGALL